MDWLTLAAMDWAVIGPILAGIGAAFAGAAGVLSRKDNARASQLTSEQARLNTAWSIQQSMFDQQALRIDHQDRRIEMLTNINEDLMTRQTQQQRVIDGLQEEVRTCDARNVRLEVSNGDLMRRVEELEQRLTENGISP